MRLAMAGEALGNAAPKAGVNIPVMDSAKAEKLGVHPAWEMRALEGLSEGIITSHTKAALNALAADVKTAGKPLPKSFMQALEEAQAAVAAADKEKAVISPYEIYRRLFGEAQARATQANANLSQAELRNVHPEKFDVPEGLLVRLGRFFSKVN